MPKNLMGKNDEIGAAKDVRDTAHLNTRAREQNATGTNVLKERRPKHGPFGKLGARDTGSK